MNADLHCHSTASDGTLRPRDLLLRARNKGVDVLAITDHDTVDAYSEPGTNDISGLRIIPGIEFSTHWRGRSIHIVGLGIDLKNPILEAAIRRQKMARMERATEIAARLEKLGFPRALEGARRIAGGPQIGRPHFAQHLVDSGRVKSISAAFKKYLGAGKPGDVKHYWPPLETIVGWIRVSGGVAVLAHPGKYRLTNAKLALLTGEFRETGGQAMEVISGRQSPDQTRNLTRICNKYELFASCGSDFHSPGQPWSELGGFGVLPTECDPVWELL